MKTRRNHQNQRSGSDPSGHSPSNINDLLDELPPREAQRLREVWTLAGPTEPAPSPTETDVEEALERFQAALEGRKEPLLEREVASTDVIAEDRTPTTQSRTDRAPAARAGSNRQRLGGRVGAALLVLLVLVAAGLFWWTRPITRTAPAGERLVVTLPDGSTVELNSGSSLRYPRYFGSVRRVELEGEAFFDVQEAEAPFVVRTFNAEVHVTGTRFGIRAWPSGLAQSTTVALEAGRVTLVPVAAPARAVVMTPGEARRVVTTGPVSRVMPAAVTVSEAMAWRRGDLVFKDERLGVILKDVERRFRVDLQVQPASLRQQRLSLALRQPAGAEAVVRDIAFALGLRYRETAAGFEIYMQGS